MVKEIEKSILYVIHTKNYFTAHQLAMFNIFYNVPSTGITLDALTSRMTEINPGASGKIVSGVLSSLAQNIDVLENPGERYGFTGYLLLFERFNGEMHKMREEFRHVIDQHSALKTAMQIPVEQIYQDYPDGLDLQ